MNKWIRNTAAVTLSLIVIFIVVIVGSFHMLRSSLPDYTGKITTDAISGEIEIFRDEYAVPYINSKNELDAYFALGYVHAQERLFQMDIRRRAGEGRLSEIFGSSTLEFDILFKTLGFSSLSQNNFESFDDKTRDVLLAYSKGVNKFINDSPEKFTIEFDLLGYKPYLWKPEHSLLVAKLMSWELNLSWWSDVSFVHLIQKLGEEKVRDILPEFDENGPTIIPDELNKFAFIPTDLIKIDRKFRDFLGMYGTHIGSNNWIVNGEHSDSGEVIIANDPHLGFETPGKWYVASIRSPNFSADGFTLPGIPGIVIGKNNDISWAVTNIMADDADFYIEKLDSAGTKYYFNEEWIDLDIKTDTVKVKDSTDVIIEIKKNHRGPIISGVHNYNYSFPNEFQENVNLSMKWTGLEPSNEIRAFYYINRSSNWQEFKNSLKDFHTPGQNFLYGDSKGNIGYIAALKLPDRKVNSSSFVYDGTTDKYDWKGYVPFEENPEIYNPVDGFLATANNKVLNSYPYHISNIWEPVSRINRIHQLLQSKGKHSKEDFGNYQNDFYSDYASQIVPFILSSFQGVENEDKKLASVLKLLSRWNYEMHRESQVASIYAVFFQFLLKNIFIDEMGEDLFREYVFLANIPYRVVLKLLKENSSDWFDNIETENIEGRDFIIRKSIEDALDFLNTEVDKEITYWQWGNIHQVTFKHMFHGRSKLLDHLLDIGPFPIGGDGTTIFNAEYYFTSPYENKLGPSLRFIYDFSEKDKFDYIMPTGQSGHFFSDHYDDMTEFWLHGEYITLNSNRDSLVLKNYPMIRLVPD